MARDGASGEARPIGRSESSESARPSPGPSPAPGWDVYEIARRDDPHAHWRALRESTPVLETGGGVYFVTRWALVAEALRDPRLGAGSGVEASFGEGESLPFQVMRAWLMSLDGEPHARARGLVRREFTPRRVEALGPTIAALVEERVTAIEATPSGGTIDLIEALAYPVPSQVTRSLFGIDEADWAEAVEPVFRLEPDAGGSGVAMIESLSGFFEARLRASAIPEGLLRDLRVPDPELGELSPLEVVANAVLLVTAAIDTTRGLIGNALLCLLERPALVERLRRDRQAVAAAVEETLRFEPPALSCSRAVREDLDLLDVRVPAGSQLLLGLAAANRDPRRYADPDAFDLDRDRTGLLSFGGGRHVCLGAALARSEARIAIERLLVEGRCELELVEPPVWDKRNPTVRALERLPVRVRPR